MNETMTDQAGSSEVERVAAAARDALTDDIVARLAGTAADAMDLIDQINRTGLAKAIPVLAELVNNGDLDRIAKLARVYGAAEDALTDDIVARVGETLAQGMLLLDRLSRSGADRLLALLAQLEASGSLKRMAETLPRLIQRLDTLEAMLAAGDAAAAASASAPHAAGGIGGLWALLRDPDNQDALRHLINLGKALRKVTPERA